MLFHELNSKLNQSLRFGFKNVANSNQPFYKTISTFSNPNSPLCRSNPPFFTHKMYTHIIAIKIHSLAICVLKGEFGLHFVISFRYKQNIKYN